MEQFHRRDHGALSLMTIFLDSAEPAVIEQFHSMGLIRGVTTNPNMILEQSNITSWGAYKNLASRLARIVSPLPVSVPVLGKDPIEMLSQGQELAELGENIVIKIAVHGPQGGLENLKVVHELSRTGAAINVTAALTAEQGLLAALAGATYVSLFGSRLLEAGGNPVDHIRQLRAIFAHQRLTTAIIATSIRQQAQVTEWLGAGADFVTLRPMHMIEFNFHEATARTISRFLESSSLLAGTTKNSDTTNI